MYKEIFADNRLKQEQKSQENYLKQLIIENIHDVKFVKSPRVNERDRICSRSTGKYVLDMTMQKCAAENYIDIFNAATIIRHEIDTMAKWNFQGSFSDFS